MVKESGKWPARFRGHLRPQVCCKSGFLGIHTGRSILWVGEMRWQNQPSESSAPGWFGSVPVDTFPYTQLFATRVESKSFCVSENTPSHLDMGENELTSVTVGRSVGMAMGWP